MKPYSKIEVSEQQLEELVRRHTHLIEEGLSFVGHQKQTAGGRLDVLMVDSGNSLVVAELKVVQDDGMLMQGVDYYDYVSTHIEAYARLYTEHGIDPEQEVRLFLIAPSFSQALVNRCKWVDLSVSLFVYHCLKFDDDRDLVPIFTEQPLPIPTAVMKVSSLSDHLNYITDPEVRDEATLLLDEIKNWRSGGISLDPIQAGISMKINGHVFAYFLARRKYYILATYSEQEDWTEFPIKDVDDLARVKPIVKAAMERMAY